MLSSANFEEIFHILHLRIVQIVYTKVGKNKWNTKLLLWKMHAISLALSPWTEIAHYTSMFLSNLKTFLKEVVNCPYGTFSMKEALS